jgi:hypothetical protein
LLNEKTCKKFHPQVWVVWDIFWVFYAVFVGKMLGAYHIARAGICRSRLAVLNAKTFAFGLILGKRVTLMASAFYDLHKDGRSFFEFHYRR